MDKELKPSRPEQKNFTSRILPLAFGLIALVGFSVGHAEVMTLKSAAQQAVISNPEVLAKYHEFTASEGELESVTSALLPHVDYIASRGRNDITQPATIGITGRYTQTTQTVQLTQLLWDGLGSWYQKRQFDHARMVRMFEFFDASESAALEVARAYFDVLRYRQLVKLAEDNYVQHRVVFEQIEAKVKAGVGRRVDFEQASGRLALAESNLIVEIANLHDVSARFQRLVGQPPEKEMEAPSLLEADSPDSIGRALNVAYTQNAQVRAAVENVRASAYARDSRRGAYQPKVELRLRDDLSSDVSGIVGNTRNHVAEVLLNFNIFNGFGDVGRVDQSVALYDAARDQRDKACRDVRQTVEIAFNDVRKLTEQKKYLLEHRLSVEKARDAYLKQFDIGQRSLLDLLDTENELFQAKRAEVGAELDLATAYARLQAAQGRLLSTLGLSSVDSRLLKETAGWNAGKESPEQCPPIAVETYVSDKDQLNQRATDMNRDKVKAMLDAIAARKYAQSGEFPSTPAPAKNLGAKDVLATVGRWAEAWSARDVPAYLGFYASTFIPADGKARAAWASSRKEKIEKVAGIEIGLSNQTVEMVDDTHAIARFRQSYKSASHSDESDKTLVMEYMNGRWLITSETAVPLLPVAKKAPATKSIDNPGVPQSEKERGKC